MVNSIKLAQDRVQWQITAIVLMDSWVPYEHEITDNRLSITEVVIQDSEFDSLNI
jgi:hypothetical protein